MYDINLRNFDLNLLKAFDVLDRERNVTEAAKRLGIGQPAMSHALSRLRQLFDDKLFIRSGTGMTPTARAQELIEPLRIALAQIDATFLAQAAPDPKASTRRFKIGMTDVIASAITARLSKALADRAPLASLSVVNADRTNAPTMLDRGEIDMAIGLFPTVSGSQQKEKLLGEDFVCVYNSRLINASTPISMEEFAMHQHVLVTLQGDESGFADVALEKANLTRKIAITTSFFLLARELVHKLPLIATLPRHFAENAPYGVSMRISELPFASPQMDISMVWQKRNESNAGCVMLRKLLKETFA
jgi:LysR family transcriptional regulator, mexEF-oprN operon transcriptional activator